MSTLSKVILGFVILAALGLFYMAMRTLKTHQVWRSAYRSNEAALEKLATQVKALEEGRDAAGEVSKSIADLQTDLFGVLFDRGRVWRNGVPTVDPRTGAASVAIVAPDPHEIVPQNAKTNVLYVFEGNDALTGKYLGEFMVTNVAPKIVGLKPTLNRSAADLLRLGASRGPWTLYELMPGDSNGIFINVATGQPLGDAELAPMIRKGSTEAPEVHAERLREYIKDGRPPEDRDPPERIHVQVKFVKDYAQLDPNQRATVDDALKIPKDAVKIGQILKFDKATADQLVAMEAVQELARTYERPLRDYSFVFRDIARQTPVLLDRVATAKKQLEYITTAFTDAKKHETFHNDEIAVLTEELTRLKAEGTAVAAYQKSLEAKVQTVTAKIYALLADNKQLAAQLAARQREALYRGERASGATAAR